MITRTRFAPSANGSMNVGQLRTALFSYLIARHDNGTFILRLEDTNQNKYSLKSEEFIYKAMNIFNFKCDEGPEVGGDFGPYIQSERLNIYQKYARQLVDDGYAYPCFCTEKDLDHQRMEARANNESYMYDGRCRNLTQDEVQERIRNGEKYTIRQKVSKKGTISFHDEVYGDITFENKNLEDTILVKSDGSPTYNLCNVVDDALMNITHVTRGCEYLSSMPKYIQLYKALQLEKPKFVHLPLVIKNDEDKTLDSVVYLLNSGYLPNAIINYLVMLGWSPKSNKEFFTLEELIEEFDITRIRKDSSNYDIKKLRWYNAHYIKQMSDEEYLKFIFPFFIKNCNMSGKSKEFIEHLALLYKNQLTYGLEIVELTKIFFFEDIVYKKECRPYLNSHPNVKNIVLAFRDEIKKINEWNITNIDNCLKNVSNTCNVSNEGLYMPIRIAISGCLKGPNITDTIYLIGKEKILNRLG